MTPPSPPPDDATAQYLSVETAVRYRCVCGVAVDLKREAGGQCPACQRRISAALLQGAAGDTVSLASLEGSEAATPPDRLGDPEEPMIGHALGHFRIESRLGRGGMGAVYRAVDESLERYVALKVLTGARKSPGDSDHWDQLRQEARAQARVNHPHVVHIYYVGTEGDSPFLAMELVQGPTVAERLKLGPLPFAEVIEIALQVTSALEHVVRFDLIHGDIKPSNVLLAGPRSAKLSDFGLARRMSRVADANSTLGGTPNYVAPEVARGEAGDPRSDMYSLGVTLFEMTFGRLPYTFADSSIQERLRKHQQSPVEFPTVWPAEVPAAWRRVLDRLLAKTPDERYRDHAELLAELRRMKPIALPRAGRTVRAMAWGIDLILILALHGLMMGILPLPQFIPFESRLPRELAVYLGGWGAMIAAACYLQAWWGTSPGKKLMQIRVVDQHGLTPTGPILALRMLAQMFPLWSTASLVAAATVSDALPPVLKLLPIAGAVLTAMIVAVDTVTAMFHPAGRSIHDLLFRTQVVLDARPHEAS